MMQLSWTKHTLQFKKPSGTSRGILRTKDSYFLRLTHHDKYGIGECGLLRGLSADDRPDYEEKLDWLTTNIHLPFLELYEALTEFPSIQFGLEQVLRDIDATDHILFPSAFTNGEALQPINGLIWMGDSHFMKEQVKARLKDGFGVLKMKIDAIHIEEELSILKMLRKEFDSDDLELRVDANGAFGYEEAKLILERLAALDIHSIEQPIKKGQWQEMAALCDNPAIPVVLDEELIGIFTSGEKERMLNTIKPQYIILKPSFIGGYRGSEQWIDLAGENNCKWWVTSALESNIGLNAIAQWNYIQGNSIPSGLGTGSLYTNNITSPLYVKNGCIGYRPEGKWNLHSIA